MMDEALSTLATWGMGIAAAIGVGLWIADGVERKNVRECLDQHSRGYTGGQDHVFMTDVVEVQIYRHYPDGTATRFVTYRIQGSSDVQSTTCLW